MEVIEITFENYKKELRKPGLVWHYLFMLRANKPAKSIYLVIDSFGSESLNKKIPKGASISFTRKLLIEKNSNPICIK